MAETVDTVYIHTPCNLNNKNTNAQYMCAFKNNINIIQNKYKIDEFLE